MSLQKESGLNPEAKLSLSDNFHGLVDVNWQEELGVHWLRVNQVAKASDDEQMRRMRQDFFKDYLNNNYLRQNLSRGKTERLGNLAVAMNDSGIFRLELRSGKKLLRQQWLELSQDEEGEAQFQLHAEMVLTGVETNQGYMTLEQRFERKQTEPDKQELILYKEILYFAEEICQSDPSQREQRPMIMRINQIYGDPGEIRWRKIGTYEGFTFSEDQVIGDKGEVYREIFAHTVIKNSRQALLARVWPDGDCIYNVRHNVNGKITRSGAMFVKGLGGNYEAETVLEIGRRFSNGKESLNGEEMIVLLDKVGISKEIELRVPGMKVQEIEGNLIGKNAFYKDSFYPLVIGVAGLRGEVLWLMIDEGYHVNRVYQGSVLEEDPPIIFLS